MSAAVNATAAARHADVLVIGAGPAGLAAACAAAEQGLRVLVLDEQARAGGQIYRAVEAADPARHQILGPDYGAGLALLDRFRRSGARLQGGTSVWQITREKQVFALVDGQPRTYTTDALVLATGAQERPCPVPGWTLPGVMTAGAAQILLKTEGVVPSRPAVLVGAGPLLYLLAWQYLRAGVSIKAIVETTPRAHYLRAARNVAGALANWAELRKGMTMLRAIRRAAIPRYKHAEDLVIEGKEAAQAVRFKAAGRTHRIGTDLVLLHQGVVPNIQNSQALRLDHTWDDTQRCWKPRVDDRGLASLSGCYVVGDGAGIVGARTSALQGELAGLAIAAARQSAASQPRDARIAELQRRIAGQAPFRAFLDTLYTPPDAIRVPADNVIACRCEHVSAGAIRAQLATDQPDPNQLKSYLRCGMGPCQGRQCGLTVDEIVADARGISPAQVGYYRLRPPLKPITLEQLARGAAAQAGEKP
ncbi:pyridine nucleotide-disulfide oxidoreductase [Bordetella ansorpii]|uniref:Pyridine nucleotide-disulfide oxidoreductase n=1 Tax=Bordetella ansorpii TaxID=288768 RepID=A0A157LTL6_9BORD|nr:FAD/NAD(P)-binding oxidoreductase [Bordetella ansorpii]SAH99739.1 pyridine nucleotide-disulfide oxidoreductase [Bordetella ansorpii]